MSDELSVTFRDIEVGLTELIQKREEAAYFVEYAPPEGELRNECLATLDACDVAIREYLKAEVAKVDGIAAYIRKWEVLALIDNAEADRLKELASVRQRRADHVRDIALLVMQESGKTEIEGKHSVLKLKKNPPAVEIMQPNLVPTALQRWTLTITGLEREEMGITCDSMSKIAERAKPTEPAKSLIKPILQRGEGVPGCVLSQKSRLVIK